MCRATIYEARNKFSSLVKLAESGEPVELTRHDKPVAVIISWQEYEKKFKKKSFFDYLEEFHRENAEILEGFDGIPIPEDKPMDEEYIRKMDEMWSEE
ncbi:MAG: type II toxin-antitoxin system prevent-host-death family antitoxin [Treponema sp.]|nr:type II toxin-antitoxin system prevent-host-death family antitoxin [Treponema sp.]